MQQNTVLDLLIQQLAQIPEETLSKKRIGGLSFSDRQFDTIAYIKSKLTELSQSEEEVSAQTVIRKVLTLAFSGIQNTESSRNPAGIHRILTESTGIQSESNQNPNGIQHESNRIQSSQIQESTGIQNLESSENPLIYQPNYGELLIAYNDLLDRYNQILIKWDETFEVSGGGPIYIFSEADYQNYEKLKADYPTKIALLTEAKNTLKNHEEQIGQIQDIIDDETLDASEAIEQISEIVFEDTDPDPDPDYE